jgi:hypothetical protein
VVEAKAENCKKAIKSYEEALKVFTKEESREFISFSRGGPTKITAITAKKIHPPPTKPKTQST